jgi:hypothetical protein
MDTARTVTVFCLAFAALILSLLALAFLSTVIADRCGYYFGLFPAGETRTPTTVDHGPVSRKANLWGLSHAERARLLPVLFSKTSFLWTLQHEGTSRSTANTNTNTNTNTSTSNDDDDDDPAAEELPPQDESVVVAEELSPQTPPLALESSAPPTTVGGAVVSLDNDDDNDDEDVRACCSICLTAFEPGVQVMTGTTCVHVFHTKCCMEWLRQHDHCPYCRQEFMTARELRQAAIVVLGAERVLQLGLPGVQATLLRTRVTTQSALELTTMVRSGQGTTTTTTTTNEEEESGGLQELSNVTVDTVDVEVGAVERVEQDVWTVFEKVFDFKELFVETLWKWNLQYILLFL